MFPLRTHNRDPRFPVAVAVLIALNSAIFLASRPTLAGLPAARWIFDHFALIPVRLTAGGKPWTLLSTLFLHGNLLHIGVNMLFLWVFGPRIEADFGALRFLLLYLVAGVLGGLAQVLGTLGSNLPVLGASGAVAGILGAYLGRYPRVRVDLLLIVAILVRVVTLPAWILIGLWLGWQIFAAATVAPGPGGIAYLTHIGGFVVGLALSWPARRGRRETGPENDATFR